MTCAPSICPVWSESSLSAWWKVGSLATHKVHSKDSDPRIPRLIWVFAGRTDHFVGFVMLRLIFWIQFSPNMFIINITKFSWRLDWHSTRRTVMADSHSKTLTGIPTVNKRLRVLCYLMAVTNIILIGTVGFLVYERVSNQQHCLPNRIIVSDKM